MHLRAITFLSAAAVFFCAGASAIAPLRKSQPQVTESPDNQERLLKVAILPFENRTPNPNVDWISALFVDSYKTELSRRYRYADAAEEDVAKALAFIDEYKVNGKARYQVFSAMTGADVVLGGSFSPSGGDSINIESELYYARNNSFQVLVRQETLIDSSQLFPAVNKSAVASLAGLGAGTDTGVGKPLLWIPSAPRLLLYTTNSKPDLAKKIHTALAHPQTRDFHVKILPDQLPAVDAEERAMAQWMQNDNAAYGILARTATRDRGFSLEMRLYSPLKPAVLVTFTGKGRSESAAFVNAAEQMAQYMRGWKFKPKLIIEGLRGKDLLLEFAGSEKMRTSAIGPLEANAEIAMGAAYQFVLKEDPVKPSQRCFVVNGTGKSTIVGVTHATVVCVTKRYAIEGVVEGLTHGEAKIRLGEGEAITLNTETQRFRFPQTLEDFETLHPNVTQRPNTPPLQCDFVNPPERVTGKTVSLRLYCMPLTQHWFTASVNYPMIHSNSSRPDYLAPNTNFPLNNLQGRFAVTAGYWARYFFRYNILVGGEAEYSYFRGSADLYTSNGVLVEPGHALYYHTLGLSAMAGFLFQLPTKYLADTRMIVFAGAGPRYVSLRSEAPITLMSTVGPGMLVGLSWQYQVSERLQAGIRYHADWVYVASEPLILQHGVGLQLGVMVW